MKSEQPREKFVKRTLEDRDVQQFTTPIATRQKRKSAPIEFGVVDYRDNRAGQILLTRR